MVRGKSINFAGSGLLAGLVRDRTAYLVCARRNPRYGNALLLGLPSPVASADAGRIESLPGRNGQRSADPVAWSPWTAMPR